MSEDPNETRFRYSKYLLVQPVKKDRIDNVSCHRGIMTRLADSKRIPSDFIPNITKRNRTSKVAPKCTGIVNMALCTPPG
jgi:hypothetical protein